MLQIFSKTNSKQVVIAIISFLSNLVSNLNKNQTINYLLSHPCLISLQNIKFFSLDNQIAEYYINFLCTLSNKVDLATLHIFFNRRYPTFPLLMQTTRFFNHPQSLVRTKTRSILLSVLKIKNQKVKQFASGFPFVIYYLHQCNLLKQYWSIIDLIVEQQGDKQFQLQNLQSLLQDQRQLIMILDDFMNIDPEKITNCIINAFANQCISPLLQALSSPQKITFNLKVVLLVASMMISNVHDRNFIDLIIFCLFGRYYSSTLLVKLMHPVQKPLSYSKKWKFKGFWDSYQQNISEYCLDVYFEGEKSIVSDVRFASNSNIKKTGSTERKHTNEMRSIFGMGTNFYQRQTEKIQQIFGIPINTDPEKFNRKSVSQLLTDFKAKIQEDSLNFNQLQQNPAREPLLSFLKSKDDTLVFLTLHLLNIVVAHKNVSKQILQFCSLYTSPKNFDFKSVSDIEQIIKCCFYIMQIQFVSFRICTYKQVAKLIQKLSEVFKGRKVPDDIIQVAKLALKRAVQRLSVYIYAGKQWERSINILNSVAKQNQKIHRKDLHTYGFLERDTSKLSNYQIFDAIPRNPQQNQARDFWLYIIVRDCYCKLLNIQLKFPVTNCDEKAIKSSENFQIQSTYSIPSEHETKASFKQTHQKSYSECSLIFLSGYLVIGVKNVVKFKSAYPECLMFMDRSDASKIMIEINGKVLSVQIQNAKKAYDLRKYFQEMKTLTFKYQLSVFVKQIQWMLQHATKK